MNLPLDAIIG